LSPAGPWGDLPARFISAAVLGPLALAAIWTGGWAFALFVAAAAIAMSYEWLVMARASPTPRNVAAFASLPVGIACAVTGAPLAGLAIMAAACALARPHAAAFGIAYLGLGPLALAWLRDAPEVGRTNVIVLLLIVWASDIGGYIAGRAIGGPKLAPAISPGKTVSGAAGGLAAAVLVGAASAIWNGAAGIPWQAIALAALTGCVAQAGDLFESQVKRHFGVKDSGWLIPGHGGVLDRLDALIAAAPVAALLALLLGRGVVIWQ
jgi:phosphatidate cytidylyltransferase